MNKNRKTIEAYNNHAEFYAEKFNSYNVRTEDIDRAIKLNNSGVNRVLELGCGNGRDAKYIVSRVGLDNYLGIDASEGLINIARHNVTYVTFQVADMRTVSYETETFGIIFCFASLLHMKLQEMTEILKKCHKWLKTEGILYISTKYGKYRELEIENLGDKKYYYPYTPEDIKGLAGKDFDVVYNVIQDSDYGPELVMALRKA